jgi:hypothetical protein
MLNGLFDTGICGTYRRTLGLIKVLFAFHTYVGVDFIEFIALGDRPYRANRFTSAATDTRVFNMQGHFSSFFLDLILVGKSAFVNNQYENTLKLFGEKYVINRCVE